MVRRVDFLDMAIFSRYRFQSWYLFFRKAPESTLNNHHQHDIKKVIYKLFYGSYPGRLSINEPLSNTFFSLESAQK